MVKRIGRDAFLYLDGTKRDFAQCGPCWLFVKAKQRCAVLGDDLEVKAEDSCGYFGRGPVDPNIKIIKRFSPSEVGFVKREVRCENCSSFDVGPSECKLYRRLNEAFPALFRLDVKVEPRGCCNAQTPDRKVEAI